MEIDGCLSHRARSICNHFGLHTSHPFPQKRTIALHSRLFAFIFSRKRGLLDKNMSDRAAASLISSSLKDKYSIRLSTTPRDMSRNYQFTPSISYKLSCASASAESWRMRPTAPRTLQTISSPIISFIVVIVFCPNLVVV